MKHFHHVTQEVGLLTHPSFFALIVTEAEDKWPSENPALFKSFKIRVD